MDGSRRSASEGKVAGTMWHSGKALRLKVRQSSANFCAIPITSTYITTITRVASLTATFERYITDSQADKTTTITQTILEAIERTTTSQLPVVTTFCASSPQSTNTSSIQIGIEQSTTLSNAASSLHSPTSTTTFPTTSSTSVSASRPLPSKASAIIAAATIPIVVFIIVMFTFCFFRRRTEKRKIADLEHIAIVPQTPTQPKPGPPASTSFGTTVVGEYIPEDSISFVQRTNPTNPVDHSLESTVAPSQIQEGLSAQSTSGLYQQFSLSHLHPVETHCNITESPKAANTSEDIHQPVPPSPLSVAVDQLTDITNQNSTTSSQRAAAINRSPEMANKQPPPSRPHPVAIDQLPGLANYQLAVAQPHHNLVEAIMYLSRPVVAIPQTPPPSEAARQRTITDALRRLESEPARPRSTTGIDWRRFLQLGSLNPSLPSVPEVPDNDDIPLAELRERLRGKAQPTIHRQNGVQESEYRNANKAVEAAIQIRRAREEEAARELATHAGNLPDIARMARQGQMRPRGALRPNARREREVLSKQGPGVRDRTYTTDAAEAAFEKFTAEDMKTGIEEKDRQRQLQVRFYGGLPQDADMVRGAGDGQRLNTRGRPPPIDDYNAFLAAARQRERSEAQERELRRQIAEGVEYRQRRKEESRERIRGEGVTDTRLTDFDVDAVNRQTANQPPRSRPMNVGKLDVSQIMPHAIPRLN